LHATLSPADPYAGLDPSDERWLRDQTDRVHSIFRRTVEDIIAVGQLISDVQLRLGHGVYLTWAASALPFSERTALRYKQVADSFGPHIRQLVGSDASALYLLAQPTTPPEAQVMALKLACEGRRITYTAARNILKQCRPEPPTADERPPRWVVPADTLRKCIPDGQREAKYLLTIRYDDDDDLLFALEGQTGRDLSAVFAGLAAFVHRPPARPFVVDPTDPALRDWCDAISAGIAAAFDLARDAQRRDEIVGAGRAALLGCCQRFDPAVVRPDSTPEEAFKGWAHASIRGACQREAKRERSGGTFHTKRDDRPDPTVVPLGADDRE
jgi:hypothetical protein